MGNLIPIRGYSVMATRLEDIHTSPPRILSVIESDEGAGLGPYIHTRA